MHAQTGFNIDTVSSFGLFVNYNLNIHSADFKKLPNCPSCSPGYESGTGNGISAGLLYEIPLSPKIRVSLRVAYNDFSAKLLRDEATTIIIDGTAKSGTFTHTLDAKLTDIGFEPIFLYSPVKKLWLAAGMHIGFVGTKTYISQEQITQPSDRATFYDSSAIGGDSHKRIRNYTSGTIPNAASTNISLLLGISFELPLNKSGSLILAPQSFYSIGFTNIVDNTIVNIWKPNALRHGLALKYSPLPEPLKEIPKIQENKRILQIDTLFADNPKSSEEIYKPGIEKTRTETIETKDSILHLTYISRKDTILIPKLMYKAPFIEVFGLDEQGITTKDPNIKIEEFISNKMQPLLNFIFFEPNSSELLPRYTKLDNQTALNFNENKLTKLSTLEIYYNVLNIMGSKMRKNQNSKMELIACNDGSDLEIKNPNLTQSRADVIKNYITQKFNISDKRIIIKKRNLPDKASTPIIEPDKAAENRRVEIILDGVETLYLSDTVRTSNPNSLRFKVNFPKDIITNSINLSISQSNKILKSFSNADTKGLNTLDLDWKLGDDQLNIPRLDEPLNYIVQYNQNGKTMENMPEQLKLEQIRISTKRNEKIVDKEIDNFSLILFDFNSSKIEANNEKICKFIKSKVEDGTSVKITGFTDRTGSNELNQKLSYERASIAAEAIGVSKIAVIEGLGSSSLLYDNTLPEGRFYCRTVNILLEKIIK